jgi:CRP/FNR family cyclic AMP-dependent transcriptional regulator
VPIETLERTLGEHPFFTGLDPAHLATVVGCASNVKFEAGELIFHDGDPANHFYVLRQGKVSVEIFTPGRGPIMIDTLEEGNVLGFSWLFPPYRSHFDNRAVTFVRALALDGKCLREKCERDPALGFALMKRFAQVVMQRLEATQVQLLDLYGDHA